MMKLFVKEVAEAKGYKNAKALTDAMSESFGVRISYSTIYPLWDDTAQQWSRKTFDRLCKFLQVPAGMLIQFVDESVLSNQNSTSKESGKSKRALGAKTESKSKRAIHRAAGLRVTALS